MIQDTQNPVDPSPEFLATVKHDLAATLRRRRLLWATFGTLITSLFAAYGFLGDAPLLRLSPMDQVIAVALLGGGLFLVGLAIGISLPQTRWLLVSLWGLGFGALTLLAVSGGQNLPAMVPFWQGRYCLFETIGIALACLLMALWGGFHLYRRHAPTGALLGVGMSLMALAILHVGCSDKTLTHLMLWHGLSIILFSLGCLAAWRVLRGPRLG